MSGNRQHLLFAVLAAAVVFAGFYYNYRLSVGLFLWDMYGTSSDRIIYEVTDANLAMKIGGYYFNLKGRGEYDLLKAEHYFMRALAIDPNVPDAWHQLARIDFLNGNFEDALNKINKQIELHGSDVIASHYIRGLIYGYMEQFKQAEENFLVFLELTPGNWAALNDLAWVYFQGGQYKKALTASDEGLATAPDNAWLLNMKGLALLNLDRPDEAVPFFEKAYTQAKALREDDWLRAYPGNNPAIARQGLFEMMRAIRHNILLASVNN